MSLNINDLTKSSLSSSPTLATPSAEFVTPTRTTSSPSTTETAAATTIITTPTATTTTTTPATTITTTTTTNTITNTTENMPSSIFNGHVQDTTRQKRRGRKPKYPDPTPGYRSSYSVNRSFTQTEVLLLKHILKESGDPPADLFATRVWPPSPQDQNDAHLMNMNTSTSRNQSQHCDNLDSKIVDQVTDSTMVFPVNEGNPKNQELLSNARRKRSRNVTSPYQSRVLRKVLAVTSFPSTEMREALANALNMHPRTVQIWFQNQRQKAKNNPQSNSINTGISQYDTYSPELTPIQMTSPGSNAIYFQAMFPNSNAFNTQPILPPAPDDPRHQTTGHGDNVTQNHSPISSPPEKDQHGQLQLAQNFLPVATTYAQFVTSPYTLLPIYQPTSPSPSSPTHIQNAYHHQPSPFFHQSSVHPNPLQFSGYPATTASTTYHTAVNSSHSPHSQSQQQQQPHQQQPQPHQHQHPHHQQQPQSSTQPPSFSVPSGSSQIQQPFNNPTLDLLAAAALQAEDSPSHHHTSPHHQHSNHSQQATPHHHRHHHGGPPVDGNHNERNSSSLSVDSVDSPRTW